MPFPYDKYPWLNFQELNLAYFIKHFREIFQQWDQLYHDLLDWKAETDTDLAEWKTAVETGITSWETGLTDALEVWKTNTETRLATWKEQTESDIDTWEAATLEALDAWKTATTAVFEQIRTEAAASATAAAGSASDAETAKTAAQTAQAAAEAAAAQMSASLDQISANSAAIEGLRAYDQNNDELWGKVYNRYDDVENVLDVATVTDNTYMIPTSGETTVNTSYEIAEISLSGYNKLFCSYSIAGILSFAPVTFFDDNDIRVGGYQPVLQSEDEKETYGTHSGVFYVIPANATKAVFSVYKSRIEIMYLVAIDEVSELLEVTIPLYKKKDNPLYGKKIVNFGDSIFGNFRDTNDSTDESISHMIASATGAVVYNAGFGGCRMATHSSPWDAFSMHSLADSIASGNWSVQDAALSGSLPDYFAQTVAMLKTIDFSTVDYITIAYGTNDYAGNVFLHEVSGISFTHEWDTYLGALRYSVKTILNAFPNIRIVVITPCWRWFPDADTGLLSYDSDNYELSHNTRKNYSYVDPDTQQTITVYCYLPDYVKTCLDVGDEYHVPVIDDYYRLGFNPYSYKAYFPVKGIRGYTVSDGTHPDYIGRKLLADHITGQLLANY